MTCILHQSFEEGVLGLREGSNYSAARNLAQLGIQDEVIYQQDWWKRFCAPPDQSPQPCKKFHKRERFGEVVFRCGIETADNVIERIPRSKHNDRRLVARRPQPLSYSVAVHAG